MLEFANASLNLTDDEVATAMLMFRMFPVVHTHPDLDCFNRMLHEVCIVLSTKGLIKAVVYSPEHFSWTVEDHARSMIEQVHGRSMVA